MATQQYDVHLVPRESSDPTFENGRMSILLNDVGDPVTVTGQEALEQDVLKTIFTSSQADGYGTLIRKAIGTKNTLVFRTITMYTILAGLKKLQWILSRHSQRNQRTFYGARVLERVNIINVSAPDSVSAAISTGLQTQNESNITVVTAVRSSK